jgi:hypothetical protein
MGLRAFLIFIANQIVRKKNITHLHLMRSNFTAFTVMFSQVRFS